MSHPAFPPGPIEREAAAVYLAVRLIARAQTYLTSDASVCSYLELAHALASLQIAEEEPADAEALARANGSEAGRLVGWRAQAQLGVGVTAYATLTAALEAAAAHQSAAPAVYVCRQALELARAPLARSFGLDGDADTIHEALIGLNRLVLVEVERQRTAAERAGRN